MAGLGRSAKVAQRLAALQNLRDNATADAVEYRDVLEAIDQSRYASTSPLASHSRPQRPAVPMLAPHP